MTTIKITFRLNRNESGSLCYGITHNGKHYCLASGYSLNMDEWDDELGVIRMPADKDRCAYCASVKEKLEWNIDKIKSALTDNGTIDKRDVVRKIRQTDPETSFVYCMRQIISKLSAQGKLGTAANYRYTLSNFSKFLEHNDIATMDIDQCRIESYQTWLSNRGVSFNSISFYMRNLRAVYKRLVEEGKTTDREPFRRVYTGVDKTRKRAITIEEIRRLQSLDLTETPRYELSRDIFMMQFYCMGISFVDLVHLTRRNVKGKEIAYRRKKTGQKIVITINDKIRAIIDKYQSKEHEYLIPILNNAREEDQRTKYRSALRRVNDHLKALAKMADIAIPLTTYTTRHSWATIAKNKGIPISVISDALGHDNVSTTSIYLSTIDTGTIARANDSILRDL